MKRVKKYNENGRMQTEAESDEISARIKTLLDRFRGGYITESGNIEGYKTIHGRIMEYLVQNGIVDNLKEGSEG